jgi:hypothetical protein
LRTYGIGLLSIPLREEPVAKKEDATYRRLIDVGLQVPFFRVIAGGAVLLAAVASIAIPLLGSGTNVVIALALLLLFGVVSVILRSLMKYADSTFVKFVCLASSGVIMLVFLIFTVLLIPAVVGCWPPHYAQALSLPNCASAQTDLSAASAKPFTPVAFDGKGISFNADNKKYLIFVFYRPDRLADAQRIVGALQSAGYDSEGDADDLNEVKGATDRRPGTTLIKTSAIARPIVDEVSIVAKRAMPVNAAFVSVHPEDWPLRRGIIQIDLF